MRVFRLRIGAEGVRDPMHPDLVPLIQHVVYAVARTRLAAIVLVAGSREIQPDSVPEVLDELSTDEPLWPCKIPPDSKECIFTVVASRTKRGIEAALRRRFLDRPPILAMIDSGLWRHAPTPIDVTKPGIW